MKIIKRFELSSRKCSSCESLSGILKANSDSPYPDELPANLCLLRFQFGNQSAHQKHRRKDELAQVAPGGMSRLPDKLSYLYLSLENKVVGGRPTGGHSFGASTNTIEGRIQEPKGFLARAMSTNTLSQVQAGPPPITV